MAKKEDGHVCTGCGENHEHDPELEDEEGEGEEIFVFTDDDGAEQEFYLADVMPVGDKEYALFLPYEEDEDEDEDETEETESEEDEDTTAVILRVEQDADGTRNFVDLDNEEELARVLQAWDAAMEEAHEHEN